MDSSPKDMVEAYTPVNYLARCNVALWLMLSVRLGTEMKITAALTEAVKRIQR